MVFGLGFRFCAKCCFMCEFVFWCEEFWTTLLFAQILLRNFDFWANCANHFAQFSFLPKYAQTLWCGTMQNIALKLLRFMRVCCPKVCKNKVTISQRSLIFHIFKHNQNKNDALFLKTKKNFFFWFLKFFKNIGTDIYVYQTKITNYVWVIGAVYSCRICLSDSTFRPLWQKFKKELNFLTFNSQSQ